MQLNPSEISELIKSRIQNMESGAELRTQGTVVSVTDGIVRVHGLADVMQGEMLEFPGNTMGMALNLERDSVGAVVLGEYEHISEGDTVKCTGRILEVPVGEALLGRVVNALGQPIDGKGPIATNETSPIEKIAPGVIARQSVAQPMQTGLKSIDAMVPVGRGHRYHHQPEGHGHPVRLRGSGPEGLLHRQRGAQAGRARCHGPHHRRGRHVF